MNTVMATLLGAGICIAAPAVACAAPYDRVGVTVAQTRPQQKQSGDPCGWIGVGVSPMTKAFADSLGMAEPYGAIFDRPEPESPAAHAHIEAGDVLTAINGSPLIRSGDFAGLISAMAPGDEVHLSTWRNGQPREVKLFLGAARCRGNG
jgi:S1-C subfamily serine protease